MFKEEIEIYINQYTSCVHIYRRKDDFKDEFKDDFKEDGKDDFKDDSINSLDQSLEKLNYFIRFENDLNLKSLTISLLNKN